MSLRRITTFVVKALLSALLLYLSLRRVDLSGVAGRITGLDLRWTAFVLLLIFLQLVVVAWRWREIAVACGAVLPPSAALRYTFIGAFFSQVLPSTVGGDAVRLWLLARDGGAGWSKATYSVLIDRIVGVSALAVIVVLCLPWSLQLIHDSVARSALMLIGFGCLAGGFVFLALGTHHLRIMERWWLTRHLASGSHVAWQLCRSSAGIRVAALSLIIHLMSVAIAWGVAMAAHAAVGFMQVLFLFLPVILIAAVPISIAGWGLRESMTILAFSSAGLAEIDGLVVSILFGLATLAVAALGGIVWAVSGYRWRSIKTMQIETSGQSSAN